MPTPRKKSRACQQQRMNQVVLLTPCQLKMLQRMGRGWEGPVCGDGVRTSRCLEKYGYARLVGRRNIRLTWKGEQVCRKICM